MYNKPITQRVAFARGKMSAGCGSPAKQTDTTVLKTENPDIMAKVESSERIDGGTTTEKVKGDLIPKKKSTNRVKKGTKEYKYYIKEKKRCDQLTNEQKLDPANKCKGFAQEREPDKEITVKAPDRVIKKEDPLYGYDRGDVDYTWEQRSRGRQAGHGARKVTKLAKRGFGAMSPEDRASSLGMSVEQYAASGIGDSKRKYGKAKKSYEYNRASKSYERYLETQRKGSEQGKTQGGKGTIKVNVNDRNQYLVQLNKGDVESNATAQQRADIAKRNENIAETDQAKNAEVVTSETVNNANANQQDDKRTAQKSSGRAMLDSADSGFKMRGFGSKTYK